MKSKTLIAALSAALVLGTFGSLARAEGNDDASFSGMWKMDQIDKNKDGMVSKAEFMAMAEKMWDMKAHEMKLKDMKMMSADDFKKFRASFGPG